VPAEFAIDQQGRNATSGEYPHADDMHFIVGSGAGASVRAASEGFAPLAQVTRYYQD
jgi:hypothetical protein